MTVPANAANGPPLSAAQFDALTQAVFACIEAQLDTWLQEDVIDIDAQRTGGVLELSFPDGGKLVINTQAPLQELWLASRLGGYHFRYHQGQWWDTKTGAAFFAVLSDQVSAQGHQVLSFTAPGS